MSSRVETVSVRPAQSSGTRDFAAIAEIFAKLAVQAGAAVMRVYETGCDVRIKADQSPVCDADVLAEAIILSGLAADLPEFPVLAEEAASRGAVPPDGQAFVLVDPVDGTREFLSHSGEFTVNIALVVDGEPKVGVVYAPALGKLWMAYADRAFTVTVAPGGALPPLDARQPILVRTAPATGLTALASRSHGDPQTEAFLAQLPIKDRRSAGSSLKFCAVAEGQADVYPRFGPTMEWDTAAGDAVLRAAGGKVLDPDGRPLRYGKSEARYRNGPFIAWGDLPDTPKLGMKTA